MSSLSSILQQARASLANPSRPHTPKVDARHMVNPMRMGGDVDAMSRPGSAVSGDRPSTAYGWNDAMNSSSASFSLSESFDGNMSLDSSSFGGSMDEHEIESLEIHTSISTQEKRMNRERLGSRKGSRLGITSKDLTKSSEETTSDLAPTNQNSQSEVEKRPESKRSKVRKVTEERPSQPEDRSTSGKTSIEPNSSKADSQDNSRSHASPPSKEDLIKSKILTSISRYDTEKLEKYVTIAMKYKLVDSAKEWLASGIKQLLKNHEGSKEKDKQLLSIVAVPIKHLEQSLDRSTVFGFYRILYKVSKDSTHDNEFRLLSLLSPILRLSRRLCESVKGKKDWDLLLYCIAILKNISYDSQENKDFLSANEGISLLRIVLQATVKHLATEKQDQDKDKPLQLLVQVTACLRNLVNTDEDFSVVSKSGILQVLCPLVKNLVHHHEITLNICRILSKVSLHEECQAIMNNECKNFYQTMLKVLNHHQSSVSIVIRVCFILGNLTYYEEEKCQQFTLQTDVPLLLNMLQLFDNKDVAVGKLLSDIGEQKSKTKLEKEKRDLEDLLTKLIRLIANLSTNKERGAYLAHSMQTKCLIQILKRKSIAESEELVLNVVRCITNLTYYENETRLQGNVGSFVVEGTIFKHKFELCELLSPLLLHDHPDAVLESARTFGNLSQDETIQEWMRQKRLDEVMLLLLDHDNFELVSAVCGVLINLSTKESEFFTADNLVRLLEVLDYADEQLAILIFKLLHNLVVNSPPHLLQHIDLLYDSVENIVEGILENESLSEEEETLVAIGKRLLKEIAYEDLSQP